jgi:hypothetical protein
MTVTPIIQLRSKSVIIYNKFDNGGVRSLKQVHAAKQLKERETYTGQLCPGAKKRLIKAIELLTQAAFKYKEFTFTHKKTKKECKAKFKLNFITLTIHNPAKMIAGKEGHKLCLEPLLKWLRDHYGLNVYVWKAELQQRGQLHYHITSDCFIPWFELWKKWGELNERAGYLDQWFNEQPGYKVDERGMLLRNYPVAGTDVHSVYTVKDMARYLQKCVCKTVKRKDGSVINEFKKEMQNVESIGGKVWDCSLNLKREKYFTIDFNGGRSVESYVLEDELSYQGYLRVINAAKKAAEAKGGAFYSENCIVYSLPRNAIDYFDCFIRADYYQAMNNILNYKRCGKIELDIGVFSTS